MSSAGWMVNQLLRDAERRKSLPVPTRRHNPCPPGVIRPGSATNAVLEAMEAHRGYWFTHAQIMRLTQRTTKAVGWALIFLHARGFIESTPDDMRNTRYRRYRLKNGGGL